MSGFGKSGHISEQDSRELYIKLLIASPILIKLWDYWLPKSAESRTKMLWAVSVVCFFIFKAGVITVSSISSFNPSVYLAGGDVSIDDKHSPTALRIR